MSFSYTRKVRGGGKGVTFKNALNNDQKKTDSAISRSTKHNSIFKRRGFNPKRSRNAAIATRMINKFKTKIGKIRTIISNPSALKTLSHKASNKYKNIKLKLDKIEENANAAIDQEEDPKKAGILRRESKAKQSNVIGKHIKPHLNHLKKKLINYMTRQRTALRRLYLQKSKTSKRLGYTHRPAYKP